MKLVPRPKEIDLHLPLAELLREHCRPHWMWSHIGHGEKRNPITGARLKAMGVSRGLPDFIFFGPERQCLFLELKRPGRPMRLTPEQKAWGAHLLACGHAYLATNSFNEAISTLNDLGIVRVRVSA